MQAMALEDAETKIRQVVKNGYFSQTPKAAIDRKIAAIIREAEQKVKIPALAVAARKSLLQFYNAQYREFRRSFGWQFGILTALLLLQGRTLLGREIKPSKVQKRQAVRTLESVGFEPPSGGDAAYSGEMWNESDYDASRQLGSPLQKFSKDYMRENVKPALDRLIKQQPKDPDDITGRNTLRNRAEMEVRYQAVSESIESMRARGVKLIIISTHADCSERCRKAQGGVYSLDGTSGTTDDGRHYEPLENVTDIPIQTKSGKVYPRGYGILYGFGCRHFAIEYKSGYRFPNPDPEEERKQYAITVKQRQMEREVRKWRITRDMNKNIDREKYLEARRKAIAANRAYEAFSKKHNRAFYPSRVDITI